MDSRGYYRTPTIAGETIVFVCEDDLWSVGTNGGLARRLTAGPAAVALPRLSPDGSTVAYVGSDEGTPEVYTIPAAGGPPRRLTFLGSSALYVSGWSRDGREIYFTSDAGVPFARETLAFAIGSDGGEPRRLPVGHAMSLDVAANGAMLLGRNSVDPARWKRYRGGTAGHLWVDATGGGTFARMGAELNGNLVWPMWLGERVAFLSDHEGIGNLYSARSDGSDVQRLSDERDYFARYPATDGTRIVYACGGEIVLLDPAARAPVRVPIDTPSGAPQTARRFVDAGDLLESYAPSPDGKSLALVSRGHAYTMPLWEAAVSELGASTVARKRAVVWLHDGTRVAYVDDSAGYERIAIEPADQSAPPAYVTSTDVGRITELAASPCSDRLAFANHRHELFVFEPGGEPRKLDASQAWRCIDLAFSPDGKWLAYVVSPKSSTMIVRIADCDTGTIADATEVLREDRAPAWDPDGKYLYFISARDFNPIYDALQFDLEFFLMRCGRTSSRCAATFPTRSSRCPHRCTRPRTTTTRMKTTSRATTRPKKRRSRCSSTPTGSRSASWRSRSKRAATNVSPAYAAARSFRASRCGASRRRRATTTMKRAARSSRTTSAPNAAQRWPVTSTASCSAPMRARSSTNRTANCARSTPAASCPKRIRKKSRRPRPTGAAAGST